MLRFVDWCADTAGILRRPLVADELIELAQRRTGLNDFGDWPFAVPLRSLLQACEKEAELGSFGRFAMRWDVQRFLTNLLLLRSAEKAAAKAPAPIERPIFVTGLPRSGTSFLHNLLAEDAANAAPRCWQAIYPATSTDADDEAGAIRRVERQLRGFRVLAPELRSVHPISATAPQECSEITAHVFASLRFDTTHRVPSYCAWLDETGHVDAYRFHRRFLQHLGGDRMEGRRWVLKCPDHIFAMEAIRTVYPDARFIFVHRDPLRVLASVARLTEVLRQPFTRRLDRAEIGRQVADRWAYGASRLVAVKDALPSDAAIYIRYRDLVGDPVGTVKEIYRRFALPFEESFAQRISAYIDAKPDGGYGQIRYRLEDYGVDPEGERPRYADYMACFGLEPEPSSRRGWARASAAARSAMSGQNHA